MSTSLTSFEIPMDIQAVSFPELVYRSVLISISLIINTSVLLVICFSRQLHYPRHIYWAAVTITNDVLLFTWTCEILGIVWKIELARSAFVLNAGVGYTILLNCLCLAAIDRYLAIAYYEWYRAKITNNSVVIMIVSSTSVTYLAGTSPFWTGVKDIYSGTVNLTHMNFLLTWDFVLGVACIAINSKIFLLSRSLIADYVQRMARMPVSLRFSKGNRKEGSANESRGGRVVINFESQRSNELPLFTSQTDPAREILIFSGASVRRTVRPNRLETRAALYFSVNVLPFWLCTLPVTVAGIAVYWCIYSQAKCHGIFPVNRHLKQVFLVHNIYNPLSYVFTSKEFKRAFKRFSSSA